MWQFQIGDNILAECTQTAWNRAVTIITGTGDMYEDASKFKCLNASIKWDKVKQLTSGTLDIPDGITSIANHFMDTNDFIGSLKIVNIGKDVTRIGDYAFGSVQLKDLITINIHPDANIVSLGDYCFKELRNLETLYFNGTVTSVGEGCFFNCRKLVEIGLSKKVEKFSKDTFYHCYKLKTFNYKNCVNDLSADAFTNGCFRGCNNLTEITFKYSVAFPTSGGSNFMYVDKNAGIDCDADGNLKTLIWSNNPQTHERDWIGLDNRNVTIKRIPSTLSIYHESKWYDIKELN